jgi:hypothetical protein
MVRLISNFIINQLQYLQWKSGMVALLFGFLFNDGEKHKMVGRKKGFIPVKSM